MAGHAALARHLRLNRGEFALPDISRCSFARCALLIAMACYSLLATTSSYAQQAPAAPATPSRAQNATPEKEKPDASNGGGASLTPPVPADVQATLNQIGDLDLLKALLPLKLYEEQRVKILEILREVASSGAEKRRQDFEAVRAVAAAIEKSHKGALSEGEAIPAEVEQIVLKLLADSEKRFNEQKRSALERVYTVLRPLLNAPQMDSVEAQAERMQGGRRVPREYASNPSKAPREKVQDLALATFIERILLPERAIDVLTRMKTRSAAEQAAAAAAAATAATSAATSAGAAAAAP